MSGPTYFQTHHSPPEPAATDPKTRSEEEIRADLADLAEVDAWFRAAVAAVRAGTSKRLPSSDGERGFLVERLVHDVGPLLDEVATLTSRLKAVEAATEALRLDVCAEAYPLGAFKHVESLRAAAARGGTE